MERERRVLSPSASLIRRSLISGLPAVLPYLLSMLILFTGTTFQLVLTYDSKFAPYLQQNSSPTLRSIYRYVLFESDGLLPCKFVCFWLPVVLGNLSLPFYGEQAYCQCILQLGVLQTVAVLVPLYGRRAFAAAFLFDPGRCKCFFESGLFWIKQGAVDCCRFRIGGFGDPIFPELCRDGAGVQLRRHHW